MSHSAPPAPGRRSARTRRRRLDVTLVLAVLLPLLGVGALCARRPDARDRPGRAADPDRAHPGHAGLPDRAGRRRPGRADQRRRRGPGQRAGRPRRRTSSRPTSRPARSRSCPTSPTRSRSSARTTPRPAWSRPASAPRSRPPSAARRPRRVAWFTGVGSGAGHTSVLELVNPDSGTAIADVTVYGRSGVVDADELRGVSVPGGTSVRLDLGVDRAAPRRARARGRRRARPGRRARCSTGSTGSAPPS